MVLQAGFALRGGLTAPWQARGDLKRHTIQVLLIGSLGELAVVFRKLLVFKSTDPTSQGARRTGLERKGKHAVWQVDMPQPNLGVVVTASHLDST